MPPFSNLTGACSPSDPITRRRLLSAGGLGMFGLTMPRFLRGADVQQTAALAAASATTPGLDKLVARAKSVIFCFQWGGPSHLETFDMKPDGDL